MRNPRTKIIHTYFIIKLIVNSNKSLCMLFSFAAFSPVKIAYRPESMSKADMGMVLNKKLINEQDKLIEPSTEEKSKESKTEAFSFQKREKERNTEISHEVKSDENMSAQNQNQTQSKNQINFHKPGSIETNVR